MYLQWGIYLFLQDSWWQCHDLHFRIKYELLKNNKFRIDHTLRETIFDKGLFDSFSTFLSVLYNISRSISQKLKKNNSSK